MQSPVATIGRLHMRHQHFIYLRFRNVRCYQPHERPRKASKTRKPDHASQPTVVLKHLPDSPKEPQIRGTQDSRWKKSRTILLEWASKHKIIVGFLILYISVPIAICFFGSQPVPITGRKQLEYLPKWLEHVFGILAREEGEELRDRLASRSWASDDPNIQKIVDVLNRLLRASGLSDRKWELLVVNAPSK